MLPALIKGKVVTWSETINLFTFSGKYETGKVFSDTNILLVVSLMIALFTEKLTPTSLTIGSKVLASTWYSLIFLFLID